jgi:hypothetical protein
MPIRLRDIFLAHLLILKPLVLNPAAAFFFGEPSTAGDGVYL